MTISYFKCSMCVKLSSLFDSEMKVYYLTQVSKQGGNIQTMCPFYILEFRNTNSHLSQFCLGIEHMLNCWSLCVWFSRAVPVNISLCKKDVSCVATFKIGTLYLEI